MLAVVGDVEAAVGQRRVMRFKADDFADRVREGEMSRGRR
jgi:hypothetical protein